jgi:hypothetical protein
VDVFDLAKLVIGILQQEMGEQMSPNRSERTKRFQVPHPPAIAFRLQPFDAGNQRIRNENMAQLSAKALSALDHFATHDDSAAMTGGGFYKRGCQEKTLLLTCRGKIFF